MLIQELFSSGVMKMGPSRNDPSRQIGVFDPEVIASYSAMRASEIDKFRWIAGVWEHENLVPATVASPAYSDTGSTRFSVDEKGEWICLVQPDGSSLQHITFDPFSREWIYVLTRGAYGMLRSSEGWVDNRIVLSGDMTMLSPTRPWRMSWTHARRDIFSFVNEERGPDGAWKYIDEWHFRRKTA